LASNRFNFEFRRRHPYTELAGASSRFGMLYAFRGFTQIPGKGLVQHDVSQGRATPPLKIQAAFLIGLFLSK
jgi:hypothetical protein